MSELSQEKANNLIAMDKFFNGAKMNLPQVGETAKIELSDSSKSHTFYFDIDRRGRIELKSKFQNRYETNEVLVRLDINGPQHINPDGSKVGRNHIHIYKEGYADRWAYDTDKFGFGVYNSFQEYFFKFCEYCHIQIPSNIQTVI